MQYNILYSCVSHIGNVRKINQDNFICDGQCLEQVGKEMEVPITGSTTSNALPIFGVFDGMGGEECGEIASYIAAKEVAATKVGSDEVLTLIECCKRSNEKICNYSEQHLVLSMGTTAAMLLFSEKKITLCNVGDSKIFRFSGGELQQISKDHVGISSYGTKPPLSQNLGIPLEQMRIEPYLSQGKYKKGDKYLICSDGLTDMLTSDEIKELLENASVEETVSNLLKKALKKGGRDNITIILLELKQDKSNVFKFLMKKMEKKSYEG